MYIYERSETHKDFTFVILERQKRQGRGYLLGCSIWHLLAMKLLLNQPWLHQIQRLKGFQQVLFWAFFFFFF